MRRGTTPAYSFSLPAGIHLRDFAAAYLTFAQNGHVILEKALEELEATEEGFRFSLSQADTLRFSTGPVHIQLRARMPDGTAVASDVLSAVAQGVLKDGEI